MGEQNLIDMQSSNGDQDLSPVVMWSWGGSVDKLPSVKLCSLPYVLHKEFTVKKGGGRKGTELC